MSVGIIETRRKGPGRPLIERQPATCPNRQTYEFHLVTSFLPATVGLELLLVLRT